MVVWRQQWGRRTLGALLLLAAAPAFGQPGGSSLEIRTESGAEVLWETVSLGRTAPDGTIRVDGIPVGSYTVVLRKKRFLDLESRLEIEPGENQVLLAMEAAASGRPTSRMPDPQPRPTPETAQAETARGPSDAAVGIAPSDSASPQASPQPVLLTGETGLAGSARDTEVDDLAASPAAEVNAGWPSLPFLLAAVAAIVAAGLLLRRRRPARHAHAGMTAVSPSDSFVGEKTVRTQDNPREFLADLKRQEDTLQRAETGVVVIDAEVIDVWDESDG